MTLKYRRTLNVLIPVTKSSMQARLCRGIAEVAKCRNRVL
jgi:hypothetical protein